MNKLSILTFIFATFAASSTSLAYADESGYTLVSCSELPRVMSKIQEKQYGFKTPEGDKTLFELQKEYDSLLSQASIVQELKKMNADMHAALSPAGDPIRDIVQHIERVTQPNNISIYKNMAAMDALLKDLEDESGLKLVDESDNTPDMQDVLEMCNNVSTQKLLCDIARDSSDSSHPLIASFLNAFAANNLPVEERVQAVNSYRQILNAGFPSSANFEGIYDAAKTLQTAKNSPAFATISSLDALNSGEKTEITLLKKVRCCQHQNDNQYQADPLCRAISDFSYSSCTNDFNRGRQEVRGAINTIVSAFSDYEQRTYDSLHFKFTDIQTLDKESEGADINVTRRTFVGRIANSLGINRNEKKRQEVRSEFITDYIDSEGQLKTGDLIEHHAETLKCQLQSIYRRGRLSASSVSLFMQGIPQVENSGREANYVVEALNMKICQIAKQVTNESRYDNCAAANVLNMFVRADGENIAVSNNEVLEEIFAPEGREALNQSLQTEIDDLNSRLSELRNKISAIKDTSKYESLDKIKAFMAWDMKDRCGNDSFTNIAVASCQSLPEQENINYLLADVNQISNRLVAELSPATIANADITNASLAQRRVIFNNLTGACSAMTEEAISSIQVPEISDVCERISSMDNNVQRTTQTERTAELESRGYTSRDSRGRLVKSNSTWKDISIGAARALPNAVNTVLPTYFQGRNLSNSIPYQEQYYKNVKLYNYANQWYLNNAPLYPPMGFWNNGAYTGLYSNSYLYSNTGFDFNSSGI